MALRRSSHDGEQVTQSERRPASELRQITQRLVVAAADATSGLIMRRPSSPSESRA
jgi:hypothetical protein